ncbi:hypothetical protein ACIQCF_04255 [Streptomyces sp. NPDC088353]|uniref:hypothetical protein n=1 Tax=Streptomyces sp. NPDC088353 TaxID=3365855 RepID=UPI003826AF4F
MRKPSGRREKGIVGMAGPLAGDSGGVIVADVLTAPLSTNCWRATPSSPPRT